MNDQPTSAAAFAEQAFWYIERRRIADAKRLLAQALAQYPQDPDLLFHSAQAEWFDDENETAEKTVRQVLVVDPHHAPARQLLAAMLFQRGEYADAELLLIGLLREYPESAELYGRYSQLMLRTLHLEKAEQLAREGLRYDPEDDECLLAAALCIDAAVQLDPKLEKLVGALGEGIARVEYGRAGERAGLDVYLEPGESAAKMPAAPTSSAN